MRLLRDKRIRAAFTLIELITVMAIILVIAALGVGAAAKGLGWVKQRNTEATMTKVLDRIVKQRMEKIYKEARDWTTPSQILSQAGGDAKRAEVLKVLYLYKWSFPQTYSEAYYNYFQESLLFDQTNGYGPARAIFQKLLSRAPQAATPALTLAQFINTPSAAEMGKVIPVQTAACLMAAFEQFGSKDELAAAELSQPSPAWYDVPGGLISTNNILVDAWGTPLFFLRHGNYWDNLGQRGQPLWPLTPLPPFYMGLVNPPVAPIPAVLGTSNTPGQTYYDILVNARAFQAFKSRWNTDPLDQYGTLRNSSAWRTVFASGGTWLTGPWLAPPAGIQNQHYFESVFGYRPQPSDVSTIPPINVSVDSWPQEYAPFVIISAGGDRLFTTWNDNLDSYRLQVNLSGTQ